MPAAHKALDPKRRFPQRANARATVEAIFEATARILQSEGRAGLNTNVIAERAGVSIGALYGYFPNKEAILLEMARRELDLVRDRVVDALTRTDADVHPVRAAVRAIIKGYGARSRSRRILMETLFAHGGSEEMARPVSEVANVILARGAAIFPKGAQAPSPIGMYVLTRAVDSVIRAATYENVAFVSSPAFENEVVRLVTGYLSAEPIGG
jgi:AcrR family transcriptional regulator